MRRLVMVCCIVLNCTAASADIYEWTDGRGVVHFTDDKNKVPPAYRDKMKVEPTSAQDPGAPSAAKNSPPAEPLSQFEKSDDDFTKQKWQSRFQVAQQELKTAQDQLVAKKEEQAVVRRKRVIYKRTSDRVAYNHISDEIAQIEQLILKLQLKLADLHKIADAGSVPAEWRH